MILAVKTRLYPTPEQEKNMWRAVGTARYIYNWTLERQQKNFANGGKFIKDSNLRKELTILKQDRLNWLTEVSNNVAKQAVKDACNAYRRYFKGLSSRPRFKSRKKTKPSFYNDNVKLKVKEDMLLLEKIGWVAISNNSIPLKVKYTNPRIINDGKYWFISLGIEREKEDVTLTDESIGVDVGIKELAVCSNGMIFENINKSAKVRKLKKSLNRKQRQCSRKYDMNKEGNVFVKTKNIIKLEKEIRILNRRLSNLRINHIHQATNLIVKSKPRRVVMETLSIKDMMKNQYIAKSLAEQRLNDFKLKLKYKCELSGINFIQVDKWYPSSKTCSRCGHVKESLPITERIYVCDECSLEIDRDYNASINLSRYKE